MISVAWSGVRSQTHVVYAVSWLRRLLATTTGPVEIVNLGLGGFLGTNPVSHDDIRGLLPDDDRLSYREAGVPVTGTKNYYLATGAVGIKPWLFLARVWKRPFTTVVTDEGIGSYGTWQTRRDAWVREGGKEPWPSIRALTIAGATWALMSHRWATYQFQDGVWTVNPQVAAEFLRYQPAEQSDTAVFLSQPWVELGVLSEASYREVIERAAKRAGDLGLAFAVRPHPVEDSERFSDWTTLSGFTPAELDPRVTSAKYVLGTTSTALLNLAAIFGISRTRITDASVHQLDAQLADRQRSLLDFYLGSPTPFIE